jgi:hypothetical protein
MNLGLLINFDVEMLRSCQSCNSSRFCVCDPQSVRC